MTTVALQGVDVRGALENPRVMTGLLAVQPTVVLVLLIAFRHSARVPSDLAANWAFQMAWAGDPHSYIAGVKRAAFVAVVCPALLVLLPVHLALLGFWTAGVHAVCGLFIGIAALETLMLGFRTLPFASGYVAGGNLKAWVPACIIGFWPLTHVLGGIERASRQTADLAERLQPGAEKLFGEIGALSRKLEERSQAFDRMAASLEEVGVAARSFNDETLPRFNALVEQLNRDTRALDRVLNAVGENPQSIVFGAPRGRPGPGEPGFRDGAR